MAEQEIWERACEHIGVWKYETCRFSRLKGMVIGICLECGAQDVDSDHMRAAPPIGDPAATVAMLEWLHLKSPFSLISNLNAENCIVITLTTPQGPAREWIHAKTFPLALAAAVNALPPVRP